MVQLQELQDSNDKIIRNFVDGRSTDEDDQIPVERYRRANPRKESQ